jgi:hypothetical protein
MGLGGNTTRHGYASFVTINEETTFGTQITGTAYTEFNSESLKQNREVQKLESINGTRDPIRVFQGNETIEGSIEVDLAPDNDVHMYLIKQAFGGTVGVSVISAAAAFQHTFNLGDMESNKGTSTASDVKSLSISVQKGQTSTAQMHYNGCRVNQLAISAEVNSPVKMTAEIIGRSATNTAETHAVVFPANRPLYFTGITITTGNTTTTLSATCVTNFEMTLNNNLVNDNATRQLGDRYLKVLPPTTREVNLKLGMRFDTMTAYNNFINLTPITVNINMSNGVTISGGTTYSMLLDFPKMYTMENPTPDVGDNGVLSAEINMMAIKQNTTTSYVLQATVDNATSNYS